jgi:hypothetical protein
MSPAVSDTKPAARYAGSGLAVFGAMAPFENVVVVERVFTLGAVIVGLFTTAVAVAVVVSLAVVAVLVPAAESTHCFMLMIDIRVTLSACDLAAATVAALVESFAVLVGFGTNVVN